MAAKRKTDTPGPAQSDFEIYRDGRITPELKLTIALVLAARQWRGMIDERLRPISQSSARMEALSAIMHSPKPSSQIQIANRLRIEGPTMTRMVDVLSRDGLVERKSAPNDRRTKYLNLTEKGYEVLEEIFAITEEMRRHLLHDFPPEQIEQIGDVLKLFVDRLDNGLPDPAPAKTADTPET